MLKKVFALFLVFYFSSNLFAPEKHTAIKIPLIDRGHLVLAGGNEIPKDAINKMRELSGVKDPLLVVIPTADIDFWVKDYSRELDSTIHRWNARGFNRVEVLHATSPDAVTDKFVKPIESADCVWICGGNQNRLVDVYKDTPIEEALVKLLKRGKVIGGTSAGGAILSRYMIASGERVPKMRMGFGIVSEVIDTHFEERNRQGRLLTALDNLGSLSCGGIGISERSAVWINLANKEPSNWEHFGAKPAKFYSSNRLNERLTAQNGY